MTNRIYDLARYHLATGGLDWRAAELWLAAFSGPADFVKTDVSIAAIVARGIVLPQGNSLAVTGKVVLADGVVQTQPVVIPGASTISGETITQFVMAKGAPGSASSEPVLWLDDVYGLPFVANGLDIVVQPDWAQSRGWAMF